MPNYGRSGRCLTCKRRRVKCDEARPTCSPCRRLRLHCGGYSKDYTFKDENHKFVSASESPKSPKEQDAVVLSSAAASVPGRSLLSGAEVAVPFFLAHYAGTGRSLAVGRGFYETLIPMYNSQPHDSPLVLAVSAVAARVFSLWRHDNAAQAESHSASYNQAVISLRSALERPEDRSRPATALTILALHLYESISAVWCARQAAPVHHQGALALLPIAPSNSLDSSVTLHVKGFVLHTEISSALRQRRSIHPDAFAYVSSLPTSTSVPGNSSSTLDSIGVSVAELQADYMQVFGQPHVPETVLEQQCNTWVAKAREIGELLQAWARNVPDRWWPVRIKSGEDFSPSISAYLGACDIYLSCQIATLWNLWRFLRLLLLKIVVGASERISTLPPDRTTGLIQDLVDDICYSVPFYLGNRTKPSSLSDFASSEIVFPSYNSLATGDIRTAEWQGDSGDIPALSQDEHHRHIVAYGAWHVVSPLSNLLTLVSDDHGGRQVASCLRSGQQDWIREQFLRVGTLLRLPFAGEDGYSPSNLPGDLRSADRAAENLAQQVRNGARFMSGV